MPRGGGNGIKARRHSSTHAHRPAPGDCRDDLMGETGDMIRESFRQWSEDINLVFLAEDLKNLKIGRCRFS
jgi:hypothetical protein